MIIVYKFIEPWNLLTIILYTKILYSRYKLLKFIIFYVYVLCVCFNALYLHTIHNYKDNEVLIFKNKIIFEKIAHLII